MKHLRRNVVALFAALSLALSVAGGALATGETIAVTSAVTFDGVPASIDYGSVIQGSAATAPSFVINAGNANGPSIIKIKATGFTGPGTGATGLGQTDRRIQFIATGEASAKYAQTGLVYNGSDDGWWKTGTFGSAHTVMASPLLTTDTMFWMRSTGNATPAAITVNLGVLTKPATAVGSYTGTVTFTHSLS